MKDQRRDAEDLAEDVRSVLGLLVRRLRAEAAAEGPTWSQSAVVQRLEASAGMTSAELARAEGVRPQSMSATVAVLEAEGLVHRSPDPADGRRMLLTLTEAGLAARTQVRAVKQKWLAAALQDLSPPERAELRRSLEVLSRVLSDRPS
jgi:DNA-binding MarR family transcriptional regulator